jgi:hypothetical protein
LLFHTGARPGEEALDSQEEEHKHTQNAEVRESAILDSENGQDTSTLGSEPDVIMENLGSGVNTSSKKRDGQIWSKGAVSYVLRFPDIQGKLDAARAIALGKFLHACVHIHECTYMYIFVCM